MQFTIAFAAALAALLPSTDAAALATGKAIVVNKCTTPVFLWAVGSSVGKKTVIPKDGRFTQAYSVDLKTGGMALKITTVDDGLFNKAPQTILSYNLKSDQVWYDLSDVSGDAFAGKKVKVSPSAATCEGIEWPKGVPPATSQVKACSPAADVTLTLCA